MEIYKQKTSKYYWCSFFLETPDGCKKRVRTSTKETVYKKAEKVAWKLSEHYKSDHGAGMVKGEKFMSILSEAADLAVKGDLYAHQAQKYLSSILSISTGEELNVYSIREWFILWLGEREQHVKASTARFYKTSVNTFLDHLGDRSERKLHTLSKKEVLAYRTQLKKKGLTSKTANHRVTAISSCLEKAKKEALLPINPAYGIEKLSETDSKARIPFTEEEIKSLLQNAPSGDWKGAMLTALTTGLRIIDVTNLHWGQVNLDKSVIIITPRKTSKKGKRLTIPIHDDLQELLLDHPCGEGATTPLFPSLAGREAGGRNGVSTEFGKIMDSLDIPRKVKHLDPEGNATEALKSFHSFRHTCISGMANADVSQELRRKIAGHGSDEMNDIYTTMETETLRGAVNAIRIPSYEPIR